MTVEKSCKSRHRSLMVKLDNAPYRQSEWNVVELFPAFLPGAQFMNHDVLRLQEIAAALADVPVKSLPMMGVTT